MMTRDELRDLLEQAIGDSLDAGWQPRDGAEAVLVALEREGLAIVEVPANWERGDG